MEIQGYSYKSAVSLALALLALGATAARADIRSTIQSAASGTTVTVSGTYTVSAKITVPSGVTVKGPATFKFTTGASADGFYIPSGNHNVTLQSITVTGANHGIMVYGYSNSIQSCTAYGNQNSGIELIGSAAKNNVVNNCISKQNADTAASGGNADGFAGKQGLSSGNKFTNCDAHQNSDDGWDLEKSVSPVTISGCKSYNNGYYAGLTGNGNGFKLGISGDNVAHILTNSSAYSNTLGDSAHGIAANHNTGKIQISGCHTYSNKNKDDLGNAVVTNSTLQ
ncbi:MAG: right-handed parallel beta-helix repeat-containing protein [Nibricoccus sp.]